MHEELVERRRWIGEGRFLHALSFCMLLHGPEAQQLAIYIGWLLHKTRGGIVAGVAFILPSFFLMLGLSWTYAAHGEVAWVAGLFGGLSAGVLGIVVAALLRIGGRSLRDPFATTVALTSFLAIYLVGVPFPVVVLVAAGTGYLAARFRSSAVPALQQPAEASSDAAIGEATVAAPHTRPSARRALRVLIVGVAVWWTPLLAVVVWRGTGDVLSREALFFSTASMVTFGGAYAVLAYVNQAAVYRFGWLMPGDVVAGLGLAESTPGPLIMVTQFVGFLAAYRFHGDLSPAVAGVLGSIVTVWATFVPCFIWIFLGAPFIERIRGNLRIGAALGAVTAAVVGVIASLAFTFGVSVLFDGSVIREPLWTPVALPRLGTLDPWALAIAVAAFVGLRRFKANPAVVALACGAVGVIRALAG